MNAVQVIQRLHQHRAWVNRNLLTSAADLSDDQLRQTFAIGQGSLWKSLTHLYAAEYVWLEALLGNQEAVTPGDLPGQLPGNQAGAGGISSLEDLRQKWLELELRWNDALSQLTEENLDEIVFRKSVAAGTFGSRRADILLHVCTHAHYTTAQIVNMFRQCGVQKFPDVMLIAMARQEGLASPR